MHGRKRSEYKAAQRDPVISANLATKAEKWHVLSSALRVARQRHSYNYGSGINTVPNDVAEFEDQEKTLVLTSKALVVNPDPLPLWNQRRELLLSTYGKAWNIQQELEVTQAALESNPKAYGAWFHRKWCFGQKIQDCLPTAATDIFPTAAVMDPSSLDTLRQLLDGELARTEQFLQRDERNFHCWNYRRYIVSCLLDISSSSSCSSSSSPPRVLLDGSWKTVDDKAHSEAGETTTTTYMGAQVGRASAPVIVAPPSVGLPFLDQMVLMREWEFCKTKIQDNFSNYSAFHYRSKLLPLIMMGKDSDSSQQHQQLIEAELQLIENAIFTEPDDQTAWWYHAFLLDNVLAGEASFFWSGDKNDQAQSKKVWVIKRLHEHVDSVRELAIEVPNGKWVWLGLFQVLRCLGQLEGDDNRQKNRTERQDILQKLIELDPDRKQRYRYMLAKMEVVL